MTSRQQARHRTKRRRDDVLDTKVASWGGTLELAVCKGGCGERCWFTPGNRICLDCDPFATLYHEPLPYFSAFQDPVRPVMKADYDGPSTLFDD